MTDDRLFPGWCATLIRTPAGWHSITRGWRLDNIDISTERIVLSPNDDDPVADVCMNNSMVYDDENSVFEVLDGVIVAHWWRGGRWPMQNEP